MSSKWIKQLSFIICTPWVLGSCATFHSPLSRPLMTSDSRSPDSLEAPQLLDSNSSTSAANPRFLWPVDSARMTRGYMPNKRRPHLGLDLAAPRGTPIYASHGGYVLYTGRDFRGFGKMIIVESGNGWATLYAHMDQIYVAQGQRVTPSDVLGGMGATGRATGVHLHFEIRRDRGPVDPLPLLQGS